MTKKFVIMEVKKIRELDSKDVAKYKPVENASNLEYMWLKPDRIIDGDRLRYGAVRCGDMYLTSRGWVVCEEGVHIAYGLHFILDPPKEEGDEWEKLRNEINELIDRFKGMPR